MADRQNLEIANRAENHPSLFTINKPGWLDVTYRIVKDELRSLEADAVLRAIRPVLIFVPFKAHQEALSTGARTILRTL